MDKVKWFLLPSSVHPILDFFLPSVVLELLPWEPVLAQRLSSTGDCLNRGWGEHGRKWLSHHIDLTYILFCFC